MGESVISIKSVVTTNFQCEWKNLREHCLCKNENIWNLSTCTCENGKYLENIIDDSAVICDEIIEVRDGYKGRGAPQPMHAPPPFFLQSEFFCEQLALSAAAAAAATTTTTTTTTITTIQFYWWYRSKWCPTSSILTIDPLFSLNYWINLDYFVKILTSSSNER